MALDLRDRIAGKLRNLTAATLATGDRQAKVVAVASSKGGVGKTTTAVNLSVALARLGLDVLLVDLDPQAHVASSLGVAGQGTAGPLSDVLLGRKREVCEVSSPYGDQPGLSLAGSDKQLAETETILSAKIGKELILAGALATTRTHHDIIVLDCPPNLGTLTLNALCAADWLLVPSDMSVLALEGVGDILGAVETVRDRLGRSLDVLGIVATRVDRRATRTNATIEQGFNDLFGQKLLATRIPQSSALNKAHMAGRSIFAADRRSAGAQAYAELAQEIAEKLAVKIVQATVPASA